MADTEQHKCREEFHRHLPSSHRFVADLDGGDKDGDGGDEDGDGDDGGDKYGNDENGDDKHFRMVACKKTYDMFYKVHIIVVRKIQKNIG